MLDERPNFKYEVNIDYIYNWSAISKNPNIDYNFVCENLRDIEFQYLSSNLFAKINMI